MTARPTLFNLSVLFLSIARPDGIEWGCFFIVHRWLFLMHCVAGDGEAFFFFLIFFLFFSFLKSNFFLSSFAFICPSHAVPALAPRFALVGELECALVTSTFGRKNHTLSPTVCLQSLREDAAEKLFKVPRPITGGVEDDGDWVFFFHIADARGFFLVE